MIPELEFMGHAFSEKDIVPKEAKVKPVANAREPKSVSEERSFLGLVTNCVDSHTISRFTCPENTVVLSSSFRAVFVFADSRGKNTAI